MVAIVRQFHHALVSGWGDLLDPVYQPRTVGTDTHAHSRTTDAVMMVPTTLKNIESKEVASAYVRRLSEPRAVASKGRPGQSSAYSVHVGQAIEAHGR